MTEKSIVDARRLDAVEILKFSFVGVFQRRYWDLLIPCLLALIPMLLSMTPFLMNMDTFMAETWSETDPDAVPYDFLGTFVPAWLSAFLGSALTYFFLTFYLMHRMKAIILGEYESVRTTLGKVLDAKRLFVAIGSLIVGSLAYMAGAMMCLLPGLAVIPTLYMLFPCAAFGPDDDTFPLATAFNKMKGNYSRTVGLIFGLMVIGLIVSVVVSIPMMFGQQDMLAKVSESSGSAEMMAAQQDMIFGARYLIPNLLKAVVDIHLMLVGLFGMLVVYLNPGKEQ